ncbi:hypothetical protein C0993_006620 [Termitomyces sp. T159_Od127]|nr:hypothetical protein C0993_006620 [Termitomyces sp. T159_Od127]
MTSLGYHDLSETPEQWTNCFLGFHKLYQCGAIFESAWKTLQVDINLQDELCALVDKIRRSLNLWRFEDPMNPAHSFHVQRKEPIEFQDPVPAPVPCQQEELNATLNILKALDPTGGLFDQPTACSIGLSACPHANFLLSAFCT